MRMTPIRVIGWSFAVIVLSGAAFCAVTVIVFAYSMTRGF